MNITVPPFSNEEIEARAEEFVEEIARTLGGKRQLVRCGLQFDRVYDEVIYPNYQGLRIKLCPIVGGS